MICYKLFLMGITCSHNCTKLLQHGLLCILASARCDSGVLFLFLGSVAEAPPNTLNTLELQDYYINIKKMFVRVCTKLGSPTLGEVKDLCLDMLAGVFIRIPRVSHLENAIERATTMDEVMNIVCFHLSNWVSYDFLRIVITHFQPALKSVADDLMHYERKLKPLLLQKLEHIAELQQQ